MASTKRHEDDLLANSQLVPRVSGMEILGAWVESSGSTIPSFEHRAAKAEKAFWADRAALLCKTIALGVRFKRYAERVVPVLLHSCCSWAWCQSLCQRLVVWEGKFLRRMLGVPRRPSELWLSWFRRVTHQAKHAMQDWDLNH